MGGFLNLQFVKLNEMQSDGFKKSMKIEKWMWLIKKRPSWCLSGRGYDKVDDSKENDFFVI